MLYFQTSFPNPFSSLMYRVVIVSHADGCPSNFITFSPFPFVIFVVLTQTSSSDCTLQQRTYVVLILICAFRCHHVYTLLHHPHSLEVQQSMYLYLNKKSTHFTATKATSTIAAQLYSVCLRSCSSYYLPIPFSFLVLVLSSAGYGYGSQQTTSGAQFQYPPFSGVGETTTAWSNGTESIAIIGGGYYSH